MATCMYCGAQFDPETDGGYVEFCEEENHIESMCKECLDSCPVVELN